MVLQLRRKYKLGRPDATSGVFLWIHLLWLNIRTFWHRGLIWRAEKCSFREGRESRVVSPWLTGLPNRYPIHDDVIKWKHFPRYWPLCGEFTGPFPSQRPVTRSFHVFFDLRLNKPCSKQSWGWWFETLSRPLWRHCNDHSLKRLI